MAEGDTITEETKKQNIFDYDPSKDPFTNILEFANRLGVKLGAEDIREFPKPERGLDPTMAFASVGGPISKVVKPIKPKITQEMITQIATKESAKTGIPVDKLMKAINKRYENKAIADIMKEINQFTGTQKFMNFIKQNKKILGIGGAFTGIGLAKTIAETDTMVTWLMADNTPSLATMQSKLAWDNVKWEGADPEAALKSIEEANSSLELSRTKMENIGFNPFLTRYKKEFQNNIEQSQNLIDSYMENIKKKSIELKETELTTEDKQFQIENIKEEKRLAQEKMQQFQRKPTPDIDRTAPKPRPIVSPFPTGPQPSKERKKIQGLL